MYSEIKSLVEHKTFNIFLCGESLSVENGIRAKIYSQIEKRSDLNVIFPEWIFPDLYNSGEHNILKLEETLAENVDLIVIPLVSPATFAEAALFAANPVLCKKTLLLNDNKYKKEKSFLNLGPVQLVKDNNGEIYWYKKEADAESKALDVINKKLKQKDLKSVSTSSDWFSYSNMILAITTIQQEITEMRMKQILNDLSLPTDNRYFLPALAILRRKNLLIERNYFENFKKMKSFVLSKAGYEHVYREDKIRFKAHKRISDLRLGQLALRYNRSKIINFRRDLEKEYQDLS